MIRPCICNRIRQGEAYTIDQCRVCWLATHDGTFRALWGIEGPATHAPRSRGQTATPPSIGRGPGTELKKLLESLGLKSNAGCSCNAKAEEMDRWGVDGCKQRREEIAGWLRANAKERGWWEKAKATALAIVKGAAFELDPADLFGSLTDLAIRRAKEGV